MAIAIENGSIGPPGLAADTTVAVTTNVTIAAGATTFLVITWWNATTTTVSVDNGFTVDLQGRAGSSNMHIGIARKAGAITSGTTITATFSNSSSSCMIGGSSFTGVDTVSPVDTTDPVSWFSSNANWASDAATLAAGSVLIVGAYEDEADTTSTVTSPATKSWDKFDGGGAGAVMGYRVYEAGGSASIAGTWGVVPPGVATAHGVAGVAYKAAAGLTKAGAGIMGA